MATKTYKTKANDGQDKLEDAVLVPADDHPDYVAGTVAEGAGEAQAATGAAEGQALAAGAGGAASAEAPSPGALAPAFPRFPFPFNFCTAVSGRYRYNPWIVARPTTPSLPLSPQPAAPAPLTPLPWLSMTVRVDVDRYFPQRRISIEVARLFPRSTAHAIAEVSSDRCLGFNNRRITAQITYRNGDASLIPDDTIEFAATRTTGFGYGRYELTFISSAGTRRTYYLSHESNYFDPVEFEVDRVANAGPAITTHNIGSHPNRPGDLTVETLSLQTVYQRAGFDVSMSPNATVIPTSGAGSNGTWSDAEMHNAMVTYWSRFANRPYWALWVLYAKRHDIGRGLGGIMYDDIGPNHRQGTAIFTDSFIQDAPSGDPDPAAWRNRMVFWTAVHEMGHAFNLAHAWQKALGSPWIPLANQPEARSYMNYPFRVSGGQSAFFSDFRFRFSDDELLFMRHAPRRFVQMGNEDWFSNHAFESPEAMGLTGAFRLELRPNRSTNTYRFLEPVSMELKLTNVGAEVAEIEEDLLEDGRHIAMIVRRDGADQPRQWRPFATYCHESHLRTLKRGESVYGAHMISTSTDGWLIDEPGFYTLQAVVVAGDAPVYSNVLRVFVAPPVDTEESCVAPDYFSEDVGRAIAFAGAPSLDKANETLHEVKARCPSNPAATHAEVALSAPMLRDFKLLRAKDRESLAINTAPKKIDAGAKQQKEALIAKPDAAAETLGHIAYFGQLNTLADAMSDAGDGKGAAQVLQSAISTMKKRKVLDSVIKAAERKLAAKK